MKLNAKVLIVGGGPAGLTAGLYLARANRRTILLEKEFPDSHVKNIDSIENYPGFSNGVSGVHLMSEMTSQAIKYGLQVKQVEVEGIELFESCRWVKCEGGVGYTTSVVIIAGGCRLKKLGIPGEDVFQGKGVFKCAFCEGNQSLDRVVGVCGGGDSGVTEALYLTKLASKVILIEAMPGLTASAVLKERALVNRKIEIRCGVRVGAIMGGSRVEAIEWIELATGQKGIMKVDGVLAYIGLDPNTEYLKGTVALDSQGQIIVNDRMETTTPCIFAAGDIRSGSPRQIAAAVGDGAVAAISAIKLVQEMS